MSAFSTFSDKATKAAGSSRAFMCALSIVLIWGITGPFVGYSDNWQLVINTGTTIVTFLMVFLLQHSQSRDISALNLKLDELIRVNVDARDALIGSDQMSLDEVEALRQPV